MITYAIDGILGNNDWYISDVTVTWEVSDPESGIASTSGCDTTTIDSDTTGVTLTCTAINGADLSSSVSVTIKRDATPPTVSIEGISDGAQFDFGDPLPSVSPACNDNLSGIASCTITPSPPPTSVGSYTITATAGDNAGNTASTSTTYTIVAWTIVGFKPPVDNPPVLNVVKNGSTVPLKFEVFKTISGEELTDTSIVKQPLKAQKIVCSTLNSPTDEVELTATGVTSLRYDETEGQFIYNWKTPTQKDTCWKVTIEFQDGSSIYAYFRLK
ncbi:MAG: PxKF domain-containing protein [Candidatus Nitrosocaldus sp.]